jgi:hypothetical protein
LSKKNQPEIDAIMQSIDCKQVAASSGVEVEISIKAPD